MVHALDVEAEALVGGGQVFGQLMGQVLPLRFLVGFDFQLDGYLVLQVLLTDRLHDVAQSALRARFGPVSDEEMGRLAAQTGYELTCFAEPLGNIRCQ